MYIRIILLFILMPLFSFSQVIDKNISMERNDIYNYLLREQIKYLDNIKQYSAYKDDTTLFVRYNPHFTSFLSDTICNRKVLIVNNTQIDSLLNSRKLAVVEIFPLYFKEGRFYIEAGYYFVSRKEDGSKLFSGGADGTKLIIKYNCSSEKFELINIFH